MILPSSHYDVPRPEAELPRIRYSALSSASDGVRLTTSLANVSSSYMNALLEPIRLIVDCVIQKDGRLAP